MYSSINNIKHKSDEALAELAKLGIGEGNKNSFLQIGIK
jgi:hypothetical protein